MKLKICLIGCAVLPALLARDCPAGMVTLDLSGLDNGLSLDGTTIGAGGVTVTFSSNGPSNLGAAIFDSNHLGPNKDGVDKDLLVSKGNLVILQNDAFSALSSTDPDIFATNYHLLCLDLSYRGPVL